MNVRTRTAVAAALVLGVVAGPAVPAALATAPAAPPTHCSAAPPGTAESGAPDTAALCAAITGLPDAGATAALVRAGGTWGSWRGSAGVHDLVSGGAADPDARVRAGSVTKVFTASVVLQLVAEHKLDLNRPAGAYLPDVIPASYGDVTVRQLLNHTSGIPAPDFSGTGIDDAYAHRFDRYTPLGMIASATAKKREFAPGTKQHYLNVNYTVLGLLIEKVTGHPYADEVDRRVLRPLGLRDTYYPGADPRVQGPHNHGYQAFPLADGSTELRDVTVWGPTEGYAAGDIISSTADLERFTKALFRGQVVPAPQLKEMFTLPGSSVRDYESGDPAVYSGGLSTITLGGRQVWGKSGSRYGYTTGIVATRDLSTTLVYSVNATDAKGEGVSPVAQSLMVAAFGAPRAPSS